MTPHSQRAFAWPFETFQPLELSRSYQRHGFSFLGDISNRMSRKTKQPLSSKHQEQKKKTQAKRRLGRNPIVSVNDGHRGPRGGRLPGAHMLRPLSTPEPSPSQRSHVQLSTASGQRGRRSLCKHGYRLSHTPSYDRAYQGSGTEKVSWRVCVCVFCHPLCVMYRWLRCSSPPVCVCVLRVERTAGEATPSTGCRKPLQF